MFNAQTRSGSVLLTLSAILKGQAHPFKASVPLVVCVCVTLPACSQAFGPRILGQWESTAAASHKIEFFADGTFRETALLVTNKGTYTLLDGNRIKMEAEGLLWGTNTTIFRYLIEGDTLTLTIDEGLANGLPLTWKKAG